MEEQRIVHAKVEQGTLAPVEQARVDAAVVQAKRDKLTAVDAARNAEDTLLPLIGESPGVAIRLTTEPAQPRSIDIDVDAVEQTALENNNELAVAACTPNNLLIWHEWTPSIAVFHSWM